MPKVGLKKPRYSVITMGVDSSGADTETYGEKKVFAKATTLSTSINTSQAMFYADDDLDEFVNEFVNGQFNIGVDDVEHSVLADVTGADLDTESGDLTMKDTDEAPYVRFGAIIRRYRNGNSQYMGYMLTKVKFDIPGDDAETKGENIAFRGTTLTARFFRNKDHVYRKYSRWFDDDADADAWVDANLAPGTVSV